VSVSDVFAKAFRHHQAGRLNEAEWLCRQVLAVDARHADSLHLLGVIAYQTGHDDLAVDLMTKAIAINAGAAPYHSNRNDIVGYYREYRRLMDH
jgi:Flp pilus assembly protein TadD